MLYSLQSADTRQAYPAAELARPAAVGKLFSEQMWTLHSGDILVSPS